MVGDVDDQGDGNVLDWGAKPDTTAPGPGRTELGDVWAIPYQGVGAIPWTSFPQEGYRIGMIAVVRQVEASCRTRQISQPNRERPSAANAKVFPMFASKKMAQGSFHGGIRS